MHFELFVLEEHREVCTQSNDQFVMKRAFAHKKGGVPCP
jgi:hypothetical protein